MNLSACADSSTDKETNLLKTISKLHQLFKTYVDVKFGVGKEGTFENGCS